MASEKDENIEEGVKKDEQGLGSQEIIDFLSKNPDFFIKNPAALDIVEVPARYSGEHVIDFQHEALKRLRAKQDVLVDTSRSNMSVQTATHEAILAMLEARSLDEFIGIIQDEVPILLDIDMAAIALEGGVETIDMSAEGMPVLLPTGEVQKRMKEDDVLLMADIKTGDPLFGAACDLVKSVALARLYPSETMPAGLLILGAREINTFHPRQGAELITFMARVAEIMVEKWLELAEVDC